MSSTMAEKVWSVVCWLMAVGTSAGVGGETDEAQLLVQLGEGVDRAR